MLSHDKLPSAAVFCRSCCVVHVDTTIDNRAERSIIYDTTGYVERFVSVDRQFSPRELRASSSGCQLVTCAAVEVHVNTAEMAYRLQRNITNCRI